MSEACITLYVIMTASLQLCRKGWDILVLPWVSFFCTVGVLYDLIRFYRLDMQTLQR